MDKARRKLRVCLVVVVTAAVVMGLVYYFHDVKNGAGVSGGTLITIAGYPAKCTGETFCRILKGGMLWR